MAIQPPPLVDGDGPQPPPSEPATARSPIAPLRAGSCPRCGSAYDAGQEYCLECGLRLPLRSGVAGTLETAWRRRVRWYPGNWIWPALLALVIAAAGATLAALYAGRAETAARTLVATTTPGITTAPVATTTGATATTETSPTTSATTTAAEPQPPPQPAQTTIRAWPAGRVGYTIILRSIPVERGRAQARSEARRAIGGGLTDVGVLSSSDYASLHPRYYVVFSGVFATRDDAKEALANVQANGFPEAYVREVAP